MRYYKEDMIEIARRQMKYNNSRGIYYVKSEIVKSVLKKARIVQNKENTEMVKEVISEVFDEMVKHRAEKHRAEKPKKKEGKFIESLSIELTDEMIEKARKAMNKSTKRYVWGY